MSALILLSLPLSLLIVGFLAIIAFLDVIRKPPSYAEIAGVRNSTRTFETVPMIELARAAGVLTGEFSRADTELTCPKTPFVPQVTEPEARAIAVEIARKGHGEVRRVLERSHAHDGICPMRLQNGLCACSVVRPLDCLGRCFAGADSPEWAKGLGQTVSTAFRRHLENHHANPTARRLDVALVEVLDEAPPTDAAMIRN